MATTAYTMDQYNALVAAIALGAKYVKYSDKEVEYRSLAEMSSLKQEMEQQLGISGAPRRKWRGVYRKMTDKY